MAQADAHPQPLDSNSQSLPVVETFHSLQGEGLHAGRSAFFIRLAGCRVGCSWCDTKHSWPEASHPHQSLSTLGTSAAGAVAAGAGFVVITGGEPLHHNLSGLCGTLRAAIEGATGAPVPLHLETSGVDPLRGTFDWITLSPKRHNPPTPELLAACHELKVVVQHSDDLAFAVAMAEAAATWRSGTPGQGPALLLQPGDASLHGQQLAIEFIKAKPRWRLSLQTHKLLGVR